MEGKCDGNYDANPFTYRYCNTHRDSDSYTHGYSYSYRYRDCYRYGDTHSCTFADIHANPNLKPDASGAGPQSLDQDASSER